MGIGAKISIGIGAGTLLLIIIVLSTIVSVNNTLTRMEVGIKAQYEQNQNNYDNYFKKLKEVAQVPEKYSTDLKNIYKDCMSGRYGDGGSKATMQWIKEHNPTLDASIYKQIQQVIESGRNDFEANQKMLIDKKQMYESKFLVFPNNFIANALGFPKIDLKVYGIVTSDETEKAFKEKKADYIKI
jgi:hypothetical protein